jgi:hypothetical protein
MRHSSRERRVDEDVLVPVIKLGREVAVLHWPRQGAERETLARRRLPRLLLVAEDADPPPFDGSCLEDWQRLPVRAEDVRTRMETLVARAGRDRRGPMLDSLGQLHHRGKRVTLSPTEERLVGRMLEDFGGVISDAELIASGWNESESSPGALRIHLTRLRRRVRPLGLELVSRRGVGHALQPLKPVAARAASG